jgi:hypothetical protein
MRLIVLLTKEYIVTYSVGEHFMIKGNGVPIDINFSPEALDEFIADAKAFRETKPAVPTEQT